VFLKVLRYSRGSARTSNAAGQRAITAGNIVARTVTRKRGLWQYSYYPEGLAVRYRRKAPIEFQRKREFLSYLFGATIRVASHLQKRYSIARAATGSSRCSNFEKRSC